MAKNKAEESIPEKVKESLEEAAHEISEKAKEIAKKVRPAIEKTEKTISGAAKKVEKEIEGAILSSAEKIGSGEEIIVEKKSPKKTVHEAEDESENKDKSSAKEKRSKLSKQILEKARKLESKVEEIKDIDLKKKVRPEEEEEKKETLIPMEDYLKSSIHLGTRVITPDMRKYVYRRRADGLAVFNTSLLDDKIREGANYLSGFAPKDIIIVCKREAGWKAVKKFSDITGIKAFTKKYPAGILTNTKLENFMETHLVFICDPWLDKNALQDANRINIPVLSICDTNNFTAGISQVIPGNNKSAKSLGVILYLLTKLYSESRKLPSNVPPIQDFVEGWNELVPPK